MNRVSCPVCSESFKSFSKLKTHFDDCLSRSKGGLPPQRIQSLKDEMFVLEMTWNESEEVLMKKKREEELSLALLKDDEECHLICEYCGETVFFNDMVYLDCQHKFCQECLKTHVKKKIKEKVLTDIPCLRCETPLTPRNLREFLDEKELDELEQLQLNEFMKGNPELFVFCPKCHKGFEKINQSREVILRKLKKNNIDINDVSIDREQYRILCRYCQEEFCSKCFVSPYHEEHTCESYKEHCVSARCRFCDEPVLNVDYSVPKALQNVCDDEDCQQKKRLSCAHTHLCGHFCGGIRGEQHHLPCLHEECVEKRIRLQKTKKQQQQRKKKKKRYLFSKLLVEDNSGNNKREGIETDQKGSDFCNICWVESLGSAPCIKLKCGHIFHYQCCREKLQKKWTSPAISFGFLNCPLCNQPMEHESLNDLIEPIKSLRKQLHKMMKKRLKHEGLINDDELKKGGRYYKKIEEYGEHKLAYYQCYDCKKPYFGGLKSCEDVGDDRDFKKEELKCGSCSAKLLNVTKACPIHGTEFIEWKCKYCCNVASWFCWGSTHFCDSCHREQVKTQKITKMKRSELPKCKGPGKCPSGGNHPPNGEEYAIGCSICRKNEDF